MLLSVLRRFKAALSVLLFGSGSVNATEVKKLQSELAKMQATRERRTKVAERLIRLGNYSDGLSELLACDLNDFEALLSEQFIKDFLIQISPDDAYRFCSYLLAQHWYEPKIFRSVTDIYEARGQLVDLLPLAEAFVDSQPQNAQRQRDLASLLDRLGQAERAATSFEQSLKLEFSHGAFAHLKRLERDLGKSFGSDLIAAEAAKRLSSSKPVSPKEFENLAKICLESELSAPVLEAFDRHIKPEKRTVSLLLLFGEALEKECKYRDAAASYEEILKLQPENELALAGRARMCLVNNDFEACLETSDKLIHANIEYRRRLRKIRMWSFALTSRLDECMATTEDIFQVEALRKCIPNSVTYCNALVLSRENLNDNAFFIAYAGIGDELMHVTRYNYLIERFGKCTFTCEPRLKTVLQRTFPDVTFVPVRRFAKTLTKRMEEDRKGVPENSLQALLDNNAWQELVGHRYCGLNTHYWFRMIPNVARNLGGPRCTVKADPAQKLRVEEWLNSGGDRPKVGLLWGSAAKKTSPGRKARFISLKKLLDTLAEFDLDVICLQHGPQADEVELANTVLKQFRMHPSLDLHNDFDGVGALLTSLDLVVTPAITMMNVAGAFGAKTLTFSTAPDVWWRRNPNGYDFWHPTVRHLGGPGLASEGEILHQMHDQLKSLPSRRPAEAGAGSTARA